jgi:hypothetical protein
MGGRGRKNILIMSAQAKAILTGYLGYKTS